MTRHCPVLNRYGSLPDVLPTRGRGLRATNPATMPCRQEEGLCRAQRCAKHRNGGSTQSHWFAGVDREFESRSQSLPRAFKLAKFIEDDETAYRYLVEQVFTGGCDARRIEVA